MKLVEYPFQFDFDDEFWQIIQYDADDEIYRKNIMPKLQDSKAIDFLGIYKGQTLVLFEIKGFKGYMHSQENKGRLSNNGQGICTEISQKIRDSLAGIVHGGRMVKTVFWKTALDILSNPKKRVIVIAWLEQDPGLSQVWIDRRKAANPIIRQTLQKKVNWLTPNPDIMVTSSTENLGERMSFSVSNMPNSETNS